MSPPAKDLALGLVLKLLLGRLARDGAPTPARLGPAPAPARAAPGPSPSRPLLVFMLASLAIALVLMLVFHATVTRIVGVTALFAFIVSGVFLIADPSFLGPEDDRQDSPKRGSG